MVIPFHFSGAQSKQCALEETDLVKIEADHQTVAKWREEKHSGPARIKTPVRRMTGPEIWRERYSFPTSAKT
jgi:hypothetical protein